MTSKVSLDDREIGEALMQTGLPIDLIAMLTVLGSIGEPPAALCDCPPGICLGPQDEFSKALGEYNSLDALVNAVFGLDLASDGGDENDPDEEDEDDNDDDFEVVFDPDFELSDELPMEDKVEAVAQLGRIIEGLTTVVEIHAKLLQDLVA
jgi:hypothetical protein